MLVYFIRPQTLKNLVFWNREKLRKLQLFQPSGPKRLSYNPRKCYSIYKMLKEEHVVTENLSEVS